jgi:hypothetical protein
VGGPFIDAVVYGQHQQLRVGREDFPHGILKFTAGIDLLLYFVGLFFGDALGVPLSVDHEHQGPGLMAFAFGTVAGGLATARVVGNQGTWLEVVGDGNWRKLEQKRQRRLKKPF